jgi:hypothetical protein
MLTEHALGLSKLVDEQLEIVKLTIWSVDRTKHPKTFAALSEMHMEIYQIQKYLKDSLVDDESRWQNVSDYILVSLPNCFLLTNPDYAPLKEIYDYVKAHTD